MDQTLPTKTYEDIAKLVELAQQGQLSAFAELVDGHRGLVASIVRRYVTESEVDDLTQDILVRAWEKLATLNDPQAFPAWLCRLAANICKDWCRRSAKGHISLGERAADLAHHGPSPLDVLLRREQSAALRDALLTLPQANRRALIMHLWGHYAYSEIAEQLDIPLTTVEGRIHRAKSQMRRLLGYSEPAKSSYAEPRGAFIMESDARPQFVPQFGHSRGLTCIAVSPDGRKMATTDDTRTVIIWDLETGVQVCRLTSDEGAIWPTLCFSPDSQMLAIGGTSKTEVWSTVDMSLLAALDVQARLVQFSQDSLHIWTVSWAPAPEQEDWVTTSAFCWDVKTQRIIERVENLPGTPRGINLKQNVVLTVVGKPNYDYTTFINLNNTELVLWKLDDGTEFARLGGLGGLPHAVAFSEDGTLLAASSRDPGSPTDILVWKTTTGEVIHKLQGEHQVVYALAFSPGGRTLVSGSADGELICWDTARGDSRQHMKNDGWASPIAFTPDAQRLICGAPGNLPPFAGAGIAIWDIANGRVGQTLPQRLYDTMSVVFSPDGTKITMGGFYPRVLEWRDGRASATFDEPENSWTFSLAYSSDGSKIVAGTNTQKNMKPTNYMSGRKLDPYTPGIVMIWDAVNQQLVQSLEEHHNLVYQVKFAPDGSRAVSSSLDGSIIIYSTSNWQIKRRIQQAENRTSNKTVNFSPDGSMVVYSSFELTEHGSIIAGVLTICSVENGETIREWREEAVGFESPVFSLDGRSIMTAIGYRMPGQLTKAEVRMLDIESGNEIRRFTAPVREDWTGILALSPDRSLLAGFTAQGMVIIWSMKSGKVRKRFRAHHGFATSLTFSPDGKRLITSAADGVVKLWRVAEILKEKEPKESLILVPLDKGAEWLAYTPENYYDCSEGAEKYVMWRLGKELFPAERFAQEYRRPDLIKRVFNG